MRATKTRSRATEFALALFLVSALWTTAVRPAFAQQAPASPAVSTDVKLVPQMPAPDAPRPFRFPTAVTKTLPNGVRVFVLSAAADKDAPVQPSVSVELLIRYAGASHDPAGKPGVATLSAALLTEGTEKRSAQQIAEAIDFVGGSLSAAAGRDATTVRVSVVKKDLGLGMELMSDVTLHAKFAPEEIERQRQQMVSNLSVQYSDAEYLASAAILRLVFGPSPYGLPPEGSPSTLTALTRDDLVAFHNRYFVPGQALLAFAGDITPQEAFAAAEKYFGEWSGTSPSAEPFPLPPALHGMHIAIVDKPDAVQTQIRLARPGVARNNPDYVALRVANQILGGGYNSRLNTQVRLKNGLTYDASSEFDSFLEAGDFEASTFTRTAATVDATKLMFDEIGKMATGGVSADELNVARDYLAGVFTIASETPAQVADRVVNAVFYGLPEDYNQTFPDRVRTITAEQLGLLNARYFNPADFDLVLVGNASAFRDALKQAFPAAEIGEIAVGQLDLLSPDLRKASASAPGK